MLTNLLIRNYALIKELEIELSPSLNIITGETGAGKSIVLGAIGLLQGNRADAKALYNEQEKCVVEGTFSITGYNLKQVLEDAGIDYEDTCIIRREIAPTGKSRAFINDTPCTLDVLKVIGARLMDIHSQQDTQLLGSNTYQLNVVDAYAQNTSLHISYRTAFNEWKGKQEFYRELVESAAKDKRELEFNAFQLQELDELNLQPDEQHALETELAVLDNSEDIKLKLNQGLDILSQGEASVTAQLKVLSGLLDKLARYDAAYDELKQRTDATLIELRDVTATLEETEEKTEHDPTRIEEINLRLGDIARLQKKHGLTDSNGLVALRNEFAQKVRHSAGLDELIAKTAMELEGLEKVMRKAGLALHGSRQKAAPVLANELLSLLAGVGIPNAAISINLEPLAEPAKTGLDAVHILFSANKGGRLQELKNAASGGEFSRLMLCIKYVLAGKTSLPTIIFDEIDTGISGEIAVRVGSMMRSMSKGHQLITITHLPQMAARANKHLYVYKDNSGSKTISKMRVLTPDEQVNEIAGMISGAKPTPASLQNARELLEME